MRDGTFAFRGQGFLGVLSFLLAGPLLGLAAQCHAQVSPTDEYSKLIRSAQDIPALGAHPFGEHVDLNTGALSFEVTDVSVPGNGPTLTLGRSLKAADNSENSDGGYQRPFGDWDLDIPRIETNTAFQQNVLGWVVGSGSLNRCTGFSKPPPVQSTSPPDSDWNPPDWWYGYHLIIPGQGSQDLLDGGNPPAHQPASGSYPIVTKQDWMIGCGVTASDGGEGFVALAPDGTRYTFAHLVYRSMPDIERPRGSTTEATGVQPMLSDGDYLIRRDAVMYVTKIQDRFGNTLVYNWSGNDTYDPTNNLLTSIVGYKPDGTPDGREVDLTYNSGTVLVHTVTVKAAGGASARTWTYTYGGDSVFPTLTSVQLPDGSAWSYQIGNLESAALNTTGGDCQTDALPDLLSGPATGNMTSPSGLKATFTVTPTLHGRSNVPKACWSPYDGSTVTYANIPDEYYEFSLTKEVISGPGVETGGWTYSYSPPNASWSTGSTSCTGTVYTDVVDAVSQDVRYTFSNCFDASEGKLLSTVYYNGATATTSVLRSMANVYANPTGGPWPGSYGSNLQARTNFAQTGERSPLQTHTVTQQGVTFTTHVNSFDNFARATSETESSSAGPGYSKTDTTSYADDTTNWVLGLVTQTTTSGIVDSQTSYDSKDLPTTERSFGRLVATKVWDDANGTLASVTDGDGNQTTFSGWYRGLPGSITFASGTPEAATELATINGDGWITALTDENGFTTNYAYDPMGRLTEISYPTGDDVAWTPTQLSFAPVSSSELGIAAGHWKQIVHTGNNYAVTYFNARWQPLITEHYDAGDTTDTLSEVLNGYDAMGREGFTSYPTSSPITSYTQSLPGIHTSHDGLNRVTTVKQDWSVDPSNPPTTTTKYLSSGFETEVIDPRGNITTTGYQAYGTPTEQWPVSIAAPLGELTTIQRDVFGKPLSITRNGTSCETSSSLCRSFAYNAYQQLCGRTDPETGTTMFGYDQAANLVWSVPGLPTTSGCYSLAQAQDSGRMVSRTYDARNRVTAITYPDGFSTTTYGYAPDGALLSQSVANSGFPVTTTYIYDKRRLLTSETQNLPGTSPFTLSYIHDTNGHLASVTYPDGRNISYAPNALGQPTAAGSYAANVKYFANGTIASFTYGSGATYTASEDERGLVSRDTDTLNTTAAMDFAYNYDGDGNVAAITDYLAGNVGNVDMTYDALDRLTEADSLMFGGTAANPGKALYGYDVFDNLTSASVGNQSLFDYIYNAQNQLAELTDPSSGAPLATYAYDAQGNLAKKNAQVYQFDMANRLASVPGLATYRYDAAGRRVQKVESEAGKTLDSDYSQAGNLMYQWDPANVNSTDYVYLGSTLVARVVGNNSTVIGNIDGAPTASNPTVGGWACATGITDPISVEIFAGASGGGGTRLGTVTANVSSEPAVASACGTNGTNYRFTFPLTDTMRSQYVGAAIYVYGDSPVGNGNNALTNSGRYTIPSNPAAPPAPASISVPSSSATGTVTVSWSTASAATSYVLQQQFNGGSWTQVYSGAATSTSLSGLGNGSYVYRVEACNSNGCSTFTDSTTLTVALIPAPPASITVPSSSYSASIAVSWSASANATNYVLEERVNGGGWGEAFSGNATSTTVSVSGSGTYQFQISACGAGGCSGFTASGNVVVTLPPASAPSLSGPSASNNGTFTLSWSGVSGATRYQLNQNLNGTVTTPYNSSGTSWSSSNLGNGTYNYQVFACNVAGCSPGSVIISVVVTHQPASAPSLSGPSSSSTGTYTLSWSSVSTATRYQLNQSVNGGAASAVYNSSGTSWTSSAVGNGSYAYVVYACNAGGCSPASSTVTVTVLHPPAAPTLSGPTSSTSGTFTLTWNTVSGATRYQLNQNLNGTVTTPYNSTGTSWSASNLGNGTYNYQVYACNGGGCTGSNGLAVKVLHIPAAPAYMTAPPSVPYPGNAWSISIAASSGASSYNLRRTNTATGAAVVKTGVGTSTTDYTTPGTYQYAAQACNASGCSGWRNAGNTTNVFCAESAMTIQGGMSPDILKCNGSP